MSYLFSGSVEVTADDKNRFRFPVKYKDAYAVADDAATSEVYVLKTINAKYLTILPKSVGEDFVAQLNAKSTLHSSRDSQIADWYLQNLELCKVDGQGRFIVPQKQANQSGLTKDAVISGAGAKLRIWNKADFIANENAKEAELEKLLAATDMERTDLDNLVFGLN